MLRIVAHFSCGRWVFGVSSISPKPYREQVQQSQVLNSDLLVAAMYAS